jgi:hypothetical protein
MSGRAHRGPSGEVRPAPIAPRDSAQRAEDGVQYDVRMTVLRLAPIAIVLVLSASCSSDEQDEPFPEARLYVHLVEGVGPPEEEHCPPECNHAVAFCPDGEASYKESDAVESGTYRRDGSEVMLDLTSPQAEEGERFVMVFTISDDGETARDDYLDRDWNIYSGPAYPIDSYCQ